MEILFGILIVFFAAKFTLRHAGPKSAAKVAARRRDSIDRWRAAHPTGPKSARLAAFAADAVTAVRWGPKYVRQGFGEAWREGMDKGRRKYRPELFQPTPEPQATPIARTARRFDGQPETDADRRFFDLRESGYTSPIDQDGKAVDSLDTPRPRHPDGRPILRPVPTPPSQPTQASTPNNKTGSTDMAIETATGGDIVNAEQFNAEASAIVKEAAAELQDAQGDSGRAEEDLGRIERMIASLSKQAAVANDIAAVAALKEPAEARAQAAKDRHGAAERRLAQAKNVATIAAKHMELVGRAAGPFYNRST